MSLWQSFALAQIDLERVIAADLSNSSLSHADYVVLVGLTAGTDDGIRVGRLREWIGWESSRLAHQLRRMESRGLVTRGPASDDGRGTVVTITPLGRSRIEEAAPGHLRTVRANFIDLMTEEEKAVLASVFARVAATISPERRPLSGRD